MRSRRGRSLCGTRAVHVVPRLRSRNISVCCSISKFGVIKYQIQSTPFNTPTFIQFLNGLFEEIERRVFGPSVIVMDNVPFHRSAQVSQIIEDKGHVVLYLPAYSPFLNPIENMFAKWKNSIRSSRPINEELFNLINAVDDLTSPVDCGGYYRHMLGFISKCINKEPIIDEN